MLKKEAAVIRRHLARMNRTFEGLVEVRSLPGAVFIVDTKTESNAASEARRLAIPSIALVDTNSDPSKVDYPIPGNDDAAKSVRLIIGAIIEAIQTGLARRDAERVVKRTITVQAEVGENIQPEVTLDTAALKAAGQQEDEDGRGRGGRAGRGGRGGRRPAKVEGEAEAAPTAPAPDAE
jgi:small subunit ribosomal protein S2